MLSRRANGIRIERHLPKDSALYRGLVDGKSFLIVGRGVYDSQTSLGRVSSLFEKEGFKDRQAPKLRYFQYTDRSREA
jgi:hypothetical protein